MIAKCKVGEHVKSWSLWLIALEGNLTMYRIAYEAMAHKNSKMCH